VGVLLSNQIKEKTGSSCIGCDYTVATYLISNFIITQTFTMPSRVSECLVLITGANTGLGKLALCDHDLSTSQLANSEHAT
jgi:hypothetical protein